MVSTGSSLTDPAGVEHTGELADAADVGGGLTTEDGGTEILSDTAAVNFGSNLDVSDDGDDTVTVDGSGGSGGGSVNDLGWYPPFVRFEAVNNPDVPPSVDVGDWTRDSNNPVLTPTESWEGSSTVDTEIIRIGDAFYCFYRSERFPWEIGMAESTDLINWTKHDDNPLITPEDSWESAGVNEPALVYDGQTFHLFYSGENSSGLRRIGHATSTDLVNWTKDSNNPIIGSGADGEWDESGAWDVGALLEGGTVHILYRGRNSNGDDQIGHAYSEDFQNWTKDSANPILQNNSSWKSHRAFNPDLKRYGNVYHCYYAGRNSGGTHQIGHAYSTDLSNWTDHPDNPVFTPATSGEWDDTDVLNPKIFRNGDQYELFYHGYGGNTRQTGRATLQITTPDPSNLGTNVDEEGGNGGGVAHH